MQSLQKKNKVREPEFASYLHTNDVFTTAGQQPANMFRTAISFRYIDTISPINASEIAHVKSYAKLLENWDSYGSAPISGIAITKAIDFIKAIDKFDLEVYLSAPGPNGEVMVQLKNQDKEIEVVCYASNDKYVLFQANIFINQGNYTPEILRELVAWLTTDEKR